VARRSSTASEAAIGASRRKQKLRRPQQAGRFVTDRRRAVDVGAVGNQVPGLVGGQVYAQSEELRRRPSPSAIRGSPSKSRCLSKETHDAGKGFCRVDIHRVLVQSNLPCDIKPEITTGGTTRTNLWKTAYLRYPKGRHAVPANGPTAIAGMRRLPDSACHSSIASVSTGLMTAVEPQQPGYLSHSDAAAAPLDRFPQRETLILGHRPQRLRSAPFSVSDESVALT
jgi:hypothetical protein